MRFTNKKPDPNAYIRAFEHSAITPRFITSRYHVCTTDEHIEEDRNPVRLVGMVAILCSINAWKMNSFGCPCCAGWEEFTRSQEAGRYVIDTRPAVGI